MVAGPRQRPEGKNSVARKPFPGTKHAKPPRAEPPQPVWVGPPDETPRRWMAGRMDQKKSMQEKTGSHKRPILVTHRTRILNCEAWYK
jgi:hypothetical protein